MQGHAESSSHSYRQSASESGPGPHLAYSLQGTRKAALRMLNGFLTFCYGALNFSCYYGDSAPGGRLLGIVLMERTHAHKWTSLPGVTEGLGTGSVRPVFRARRLGRGSSALGGRST